MTATKDSESGINSFIRMLERRDVLSTSDISLIRSLPLRVELFRNGEELVAENSRPQESCMILKGFAARSQHLRAGERQITGIHIAGDFVDLHAYLLKEMDHSVIAIGECEAGFIAHRDIRRITDESRHLTRLFWLSTVIDGAIQRTWITSLGRRSSEQHMAHILCELYLRLEAAGAASNYRFELPLTQLQLSDILGLSAVHVNRKLQELRAKKLVEWRNGTVFIRDFTALAKLADFDPVYLSLHKEPR